MENRRAITELADDPRNPRAIKPAAIDGLKASLSAFGDIAGLVFNARTSHLVSGHQRLRALRDAGATEWVRDKTGGYIEHPKTGERFRVRIVEWDERTERAANIEANSPAISGYFTDALQDQLEALQTDFPDLGVSFDALRLEELLSASDVSEEDLAGPEVTGNQGSPARIFRFEVSPDDGLMVDAAFSALRGGRREKAVDDNTLFVEICRRAVGAK